MIRFPIRNSRRWARYGEPEEIRTRAEVISLHGPLTLSTFHMLTSGRSRPNVDVKPVQGNYDDAVEQTRISRSPGNFHSTQVRKKRTSHCEVRPAHLHLRVLAAVGGMSVLRSAGRNRRHDTSQFRSVLRRCFRRNA